MIVVIGDSIAAGQHVAYGRSWPFLLREDGLDIVPAGISGDTTRLGLERFPQFVQNDPPSTVIIQFGHNDCNRWQTDRGLPRVAPSAYKANLEEMIERCRTFRARPLLCTLTPSRRSEQHAEDTARYDRLLRRVANDEGVTLIDVRSAFLPDMETEPPLLMEDGLHLTEMGHRVYAAIVRQVLDAEGIA
jgi:lysophospholipase L1-like esterase